MDKLAVLRKSELFRDLRDQDLRIVEAMAEPLQFSKGETVCKQGQLEERIYVVEDGAVAILLEMGALPPRQVQAVGSYQSFGWSAMVEPYLSTATVRAVSDAALLSFRADELRALCAHRPDIGSKIHLAVARVLAKRLRQSYLQLLGVVDEEAADE